MTAERSTGHTVALVDDDPDYLEATRRLLEREGHRVLTATNGREALALLKQQHADVLLLDYFMPAMTGEQVVTELRGFDDEVQIILQTGYASERPPRELLARLDIQGYYDKAEGPEKLLLWTDVGLKACRTLHAVHTSRRGLRRVLEATAGLHTIQPLGDLLRLALADAVALVEEVRTRDTADRGKPADALIAVVDESGDLHPVVGCGRFEGPASLDGEPARLARTLLAEVMQDAQVRREAGATAVRLRVGELTLGGFYVEGAELGEAEVELLQVLANQVAVAIRNAQLNELATVDRLTGSYMRRFFEQWLMRELRVAFRSRAPLALLMIDVDGMKRINDTGGHLTGDLALSTIGRVLRQAIRGSEVVGRYGGDEFTIVLPGTQREGAEVVADRILTAMLDQRVPAPGGDFFALRVTIGISVLEPLSIEATEMKRMLSTAYVEETSRLLLESADSALYRAKRRGAGQFETGGSVAWPATNFPETPSMAPRE